MKIQNKLQLITKYSIQSRRRFITKYTSLSGVLSSKKNQESVWFESSLEKDFALILEFNPAVSHYVEQPLTIEYIQEDKNKIYTPDFLVFFHDNTPNWLCEIKPKVILEKNSDLLMGKFKAAKRFCEEESYEFKIYTDEDIRTSYLENIKFLNKYEIDFTSEQCLDLVRRKMSEIKTITIKEFIAFFDNANNSIKGKCIYAFWFLLKIGEIGCDLSLTLNLNTEIWNNYEV